jgi:uncharacterized phage infection (PIP) family protein YhgE
VIAVIVTGGRGHYRGEMKCLAGMLAALWVAAAQSQTPDPRQPTMAEQTPTAEQAAAPAVVQQAAGTGASTADGAASAGAQQAAAVPVEIPAAQEAESTSQSHAQTAASASSPASASAPGGAALAGAQQAVAGPSADVAQAIAYLKSAAADFTNCRRASACYIYFDTFGVAIPFADGSIVPFSHVQRLTATSRECIKKAKVLEEEGNRSLAVQWAMAARIENRSVRDWLGNHPDAVLEALRHVTVP